MDAAGPVEVELALTHAGSYRAKAVILPPLLVSIGSSEQAILRIEEPEVPEIQDLLEVGVDGARLLLPQGTELQLILDEERKSLDELKEEGRVTEDGDLSIVPFPQGSNAVVTLGSVSVMMKCRPASDTATHVDGAGEDVLVCGVCGSDLPFVVRHSLALSTCARCQTRNRTMSGPMVSLPSGSLGPEGTEADAPLDALIGSFGADEKLEEDELAEGPTDQGVPLDSPSAPQHFEEEATQPSLSLRGSDLRRGEEERVARKREEIDGPVEDEDLPHSEEPEEPGVVRRKRSRRRRRRDAPLWTPPLIALAVVGLVSGAIGLCLIFYAVLAG